MSAKEEVFDITRLLSTPTNHMEVEGELCKLFYKKFGDEALPIIQAVFREWGLYIGQRRKAQMQGEGLKAAAETHLRPALEREPKPEIIELSDERVEIKVFTCPYCLKGWGRPLCAAMEAMDGAIMETLLGREIAGGQLEVIAAGDECCHSVITLG